MTGAQSAADVDVVAVGAIAEALQAFAKALRANQLYLPNNPTRHRATEAAGALFAAVWHHTDRVRLDVRETELLWEEEVVYRDLERGTEALPFLFHRDGLREIEFRRDFEIDELSALLDLIQRAKTAQPDEDDLVTLLWVADLSFVRYRHVEIGGETDLPAALSGGNGVASATSSAPQLGAIVAETQAIDDGPAPGIVRLDDFDSTLYFLEPRELAYLKSEVEREYSSDGKRAVLSILFDIIESQNNIKALSETVGVIESWLIDLISNAEYELVAFLLREAAETVRRTPDLEPSLRASLSALPARLSHPTVIGQLVQALDESSRVPRLETLDDLFGQLHAAALAPLLAWLTGANASPVRGAVERAATTLASANTGELARLLECGDQAVVRSALRLASRLKSPATVPGLGKVLRSTDATLRTEAVLALGEIASAGALQTLERAIDDLDRDVRVATFRAVANNNYANALPKLAQSIRRKDLSHADLSEKMALFEAYGMLCGEDGVELLAGLLNGRALLRYRESPEVRACAARALGIVGTPSALAALQKSSDTRDIVVRTAVLRAAKGNA
ncbi:MAG: HEAT repeat domain-containing protein [Gemmatimonadaceae bacterium]